MIPFPHNIEWVLGRDKRYLKLSETCFEFRIELPENYVPDNDVCSKLFENLEISVNHETITHKSCDLDYSVTSYVLNKVTYDDSYVASTMDINGLFDMGLVSLCLKLS